jgi:hypothetical protein
MKVAFRFENGSSECILTPENARDKSYIDLCIDGRNEIKLKPTSSDSIILCFTASELKSNVLGMNLDDIRIYEGASNDPLAK